MLNNHILCGLDVPEQLKVSHGELGSNLHGAELQQRDLTLSQEILGILVRTQRLCLHIVLQVVPTGRTQGERIRLSIAIK